jgi:hypothetical protein
MKDGLRAQGWMDPIQIEELRKDQNSELIDDANKIDDLEVRVTQLQTLANDTRNSLMEAYQQGSLSARGCATIAANIEDELKKIFEGD